MYPSSFRLSNFSYLLLLLFLWQTPSLFFLGNEDITNTIYAQNLTAPTISEGSVKTVSPSKISLAQWQNLQAASSQDLLAKPDTIEFLENNFNLDGAYGEMKSGSIVTNWEALAKNMSTSGLALAGAYAVWRRRRLQQLKSLRGGDGTALENLFATSFNPPENQSTNTQTKNTITTTPLPSITPPSTNQAWESWGKKQGLFATGATLSALFLLWKKRQQPTTTPSSWEKYFRSFFNPNNTPSYQTFYQSVKVSSTSQVRTAQTKAALQFENEHPEPVAPAKTPAVKTYETLAAYNYMRDFPPSAQAIKAANAIRYDNNAKVAAVKTGLLEVWQQYFYFKSVGNTRAAEAMYRKAYSLATFGNRFATARQKWEMENLEYQAQYQFTQLNQNYRTYQQAVQAYEPLKTAYERQKATVLAAAAAPFTDWESSLWQWWQQATDKVNKAQQWISKLNQLRTQNTDALAHKKEQETNRFKQNLALITQVFDEKALKALLNGQADEKSLPAVSPLAPATAATQLRAKLETLRQEENNHITIEQYEDEQARLVGYHVIRGRNGKRYYYQSYYNARYDRWEQRHVYLSVAQKNAATKQRTQVYAQKAQAAQQSIQTQIQRYQAEQLIKILKEKEAKFNTPLHQLAQFLRSVQPNQNNPVTQSIWLLLRQLNQWQTTLQQQQAAVVAPNLSWTETTTLKKSIESLKAEIKSHQAQIRTYQQASLSASNNEVQPVVQAAITTFKQNDLKNNKIYQHLETLHTAREFYRTYGQDISVIEPLKTKLKAKLDSLAALEDASAYTHGYEFYDYQALKADYIKLLNNQLPDVYVPNWSWYNSGYRTKRTTAVPNRNDAKLHRWYHKSLTLFNNESKQKYQTKIKTREAALFAQREAEFNQQQLVALKEVFSAKDIAAYQVLVQAETDAQTQLREAEAINHTQEALFYSNLTQQNQTLLTAPPSPKALAIKTLKKSDVSHIALSYQSNSNQTSSSHTQSIPPQLLEPLWQSYRRFNAEWQFNQFKQEAQRLTAQTKAQYKNGLIADAGLPPAPTQTKTVHDYLKDPQAFNTDIEKQIKAVETGIPALKKKFSDQAYLATALAQAKSKIKALKRYRSSGPTEVKQYQQDLKQWKQDHAYTLSQIETGAANHFKDLETYLSGFWQQADSITETKAKAIAAENIIDTRDTVEKVTESPWGDSSENPALKAELETFMQNLSSQDSQEAGHFLLSNEATNNQAKIYQTYQSKFLRSQGLTWDTYSNDRIKNLHPEIREKTIEFINKVQDDLGINLRVNIDGNFRSFDHQLKLYCNDKDTGICKDSTKWDNSGKWKSNAKPGESYHNYGLAVDFSEINKNDTVSNSTNWKKVALIGSEIGFDQPLPSDDAGHFQMTFNNTVATLKKKHKNGDSENGFVSLSKAVDIKINKEDVFEALSYNFLGKGISQNKAEKFKNYSEEYFQVWAKYKDGPVMKNILREIFIKEELSNIPLIPLTTYKQFNKELSGISNGARTEIRKVHKDIIKFLKAGKNFESELASRYIQRIRDADHGNFTNEVAAYFAADAYSNTSDQLFGFERISDKYNIIPSDLKDEASGFQASMYENNDTIVIAFTGTDEIIDWKTNTQNAIGILTKQYKKAEFLARKAGSITNKKIVFTGHSLGGGLAALAGALTNFKTVTFNSAGNNPFVLKKTGVQLNFMETINAYTDFALPDFIAEKFEKQFPNITNHVTRGDLLTTIQEKIPLLPVALGSQVKHGSILNNWVGVALMNKDPKVVMLAIAGGSIYHTKY